MKYLEIKITENQWGFCIKIIEQSHVNHDFADDNNISFEASNGFRLISNAKAENPCASICRRAFWVFAGRGNDRVFIEKEGKCFFFNGDRCPCKKYEKYHVCYSRDEIGSEIDAKPTEIKQYMQMLQVAVEEYNETFKD